MPFKIIWSAFAEIQLDEIYSYYKEKASESIAKKLIKEIIEAPDILITNPKLGQKETVLKKRKLVYRYLIYKNYKLIYSVNIQDNFIKIADVFDTRQNLQKLKRTL